MTAEVAGSEWLQLARLRQERDALQKALEEAQRQFQPLLRQVEVLREERDEARAEVEMWQREVSGRDADLDRLRALLRQVMARASYCVCGASRDYPVYRFRHAAACPVVKEVGEGEGRDE